MGKLAVQCQGREGGAGAAAVPRQLAVATVGQGLSSLPAKQPGKENASGSGVETAGCAGLFCHWVLRGLIALGLSRAVINVCCFHWDALCLDLTVLSVVSSVFSPLYSCAAQHLRSAYA